MPVAYHQLGPSLKKIYHLFSDFLYHETAVLPRNREGQEMCENWRVLRGAASKSHDGIHPN